MHVEWRQRLAMRDHRDDAFNAGQQVFSSGCTSITTRAPARARSGA